MRFTRIGGLLLGLIVTTHATVARSACYGNDGIDPVDDFDDAQVGAAWSTAEGCGSVIEVGGALELTKDSGCTGGTSIRLASPHSICGDFDAWTDFNLVNFTVPGSGGRFAGFQVKRMDGSPFATIERYNRALGACNPATNNYKAFTLVSSNCDPSVAWQPTTDMTGRFRIRRVGSMVTIYYWNSTWIELQSAALTGEDVYLQLYTGAPSDGSSQDVRFDDLYVESEMGVVSASEGEFDVESWGRAKASYR